jgi:hypothetical protein
MTDLRRSYDLLMMKVLSLLQEEDQKVASAIVSSRKAIWRLLADNRWANRPRAIDSAATSPDPAVP